MRKFYSRVLIILSILASGLSAHSQVVQIGTGTTLPDNTLYGPVYRFSATSTTLAARSNMLYTAAELAAAGVPSGAMITQVEFFKGNDANFVTPANYKMLMANTSNTALATSLTWASVLTTHTEVYTNASFNLPAVTGWVPWTLSTPFVYTGGALEIATEHTMAGNGGATNNITWQYSGAEGSSASLIVGATGSSLPATLNGTVADYKNRPNIRITFAGSACVAPPNPGTTTSSVTQPICTGTVVSIGLTGQSFGIGLSFQLQSSSTSGGTYTDVGASQQGSNFSVSPTTTTWYRVAVTCSGNTQYSVPVEVVVSAGFPGGTYTINGASPTGGTNFQTFQDAIDALSCGITGPVVFNVTPGTYEEQITITAIGGASAVNTITFNGNDATIQEAPVTGTRHIIKLDGADFVTFRNLNLLVQTGTTFGWGFHLTNGADNNTIDSCTIDISNITNITQSNSGGIVVSGSSTSVLTDGSASNNTISNNEIIGAYQGIIINGATGALDAVNNIIRNNIIRDFYATGIEITETNNILITGNDFNRANRGTVGVFTGIELGAGNQNAIVSNNRIHNTHTIASAQTGTAYGIYASGDANAGSENRIFNNLIYNFDSEDGIQYGIYNTNANGHYYYHNTIVLNDNATSSNDVAKGFYQTGTASNIEFRNNIVYVTRGGTGDKMAIHLSATTSTVISNNNVLYVNATPGFTGAFGTTTYATLADWQGANGGAYDQQSVNVDPLFADVATGNFYPNNPTIAILGATVGVTNDILNVARNTGAPTPGAYEIVSPPCIAPPNPGTTTSSVSLPICTGTGVTISLTGQSFGAGITYQLQSSSTSGGTYTDVGAIQTGPTFSVSPTTTTWYRVAVTCSGNTQYSVPVEVVVSAGFPAGTYTINGASPTGGTNFQTFAHAINALSCGITGPVVFNVAPGFYEEQIIIPAIGGTSAVNTITFNGNDATIQYAPETGSRHIIKLDGADYITFRNLNVFALSGFNFGWGFHLTNGADNNTIDSCTIDITNVTSTSQSNSAGIVVSGSSTSVLTDGSASNNIISNNEIIGAYQGIIINGATGALDAVNNIIRNNIIRDFYATGIEITETSNILITDNDFNRANRGTVGVFTGVELGAGNQNAIVSNNRIHNTHTIASAQTGTAYGIYSSGDANAGSENRIFNNLIYNFDSEDGIQYGIYNTNANGHYYYHNTIVLNDDATISDVVAKGFYQTGAASNIEFRNNIVYVTRGGTGDKMAIHLNTTTSTVISNNNVLYVNATPGFTGAFGTTTYATLADWQGANGGAYDQQSVNVDPVFADASTGNFYPNNSAISSIGAAVGVTTDIIGATRSAGAPTPGAFEVVAAVGIDMGAVTLVTPADQDCFGSAETITVQIRNYSANTHNFIASPVTVNVAVTGPNATTFTPVVVNTGTLAPDGTRNIVISTTFNMSAPGTYVFSASTTVTNDVNDLNDAMPSAQRVVEPLEAGTLSSTPPSYCVTGGIPTLTLTGSSGGAIQWQTSTTGAPGSWTNVGTNDVTYTPPSAITSTTYFRTYSTCGVNGDTSNVVTVNVFSPQLISTVAASRCGPGSVNLTATPAAGYTINWYTAATGGVPVFTGSSFNTPIISSTTSYYAAATSGGISGTLGAPNANISTSRASQTGENTVGVNFDVLSPNMVINSVDIYPTSTVGTSFTIQVRQGTTVIASYTGTTTVQGSTTAPVAQQVPVNLVIPVGTGYRMVYSDNPGSIRNDGGDAFPYVLPGVISLTSSSLSGFYYFFYNWQVSTGCESPRTEVVATVTAAPDLDVTNSLTVCNNAVVPLQVNSSLASFDSYTWAPITGLFADPNATVPYTGGSTSIVFAKIGTAGTYTYIATANNTGTNCQNIDSLQLTVLPAAVTVSALPQEVCVSGPTTLSYTPFEGFGSATAQWFSSPDGTTYTAITNATGVSYTTPTLTASTFYKLEIKDGAGNVCLNPTFTVNVNNPLVINAADAARCGPGTLDLTATGSAGASLNWYTVATGGVPVFTGSNFTTPSLNATTTYYVGAQQGGGNSTVGVSPSATNCGTRTSSTATDWPLRFNTTAPVVINSAWVIPTGTSLTVALRNAQSTANLQSATFTFTAAQVGVPQQITLGWSVPASGSYQLTNTAGGVNRIGTFTCTYPFVSAFGGFSIVGSATTSTSATNTTTYNSFFDINVSEGCESPRTAVTATVSPNTGILTQPVSQAVCTGANVTFSVDAEGANLNYQWRKGTTNIANATNSTLVLNAVTVADAGTYNVVITGLCGNVTSADVTLTVAANNAWLGVISNDWNTPGNWCGGVPTSTSDVVITAGTPFAPVVNGIANVRNLSINSGASVTVSASAFLNIFGDFSNSGTFSAPNGFVAFKGAANQNIGAMEAGTVIMNGTGGVTLVGNMTVTNALVLTNGHITLGANNLILNGSSAGSANSHVITNGTGGVISNNINFDAVTIPVGPNSTSYNPVVISNGQGRNYTVRVATGINPAINNPNRAVNRTWNVTPNTSPSSPVNIVFQFVDADMNANASATLVMEAAVHNGTTWNVVSPATGVTPSGTPADRQVGISTTQFGPTVIGNFGAISFPTATANVDADVTRIVMMPNVVNNQSVLRVNVRRTMAINWSVVDANGRIVMSFSKQMLAGQNDIQLVLGHLAAGAYQIVGSTEKGKTGVVRFVKL